MQNEVNLVLKRIRKLRNKGHYEKQERYQRNSDWGGYANALDPPQPIYDRWFVIDADAIKELNSIYDSHASPLIRYATARALGKKASTKFGYYPLFLFAHKIGGVVMQTKLEGDYTLEKFVHEHPTMAIATGIVAVGTASALSCWLYQCLSK